MYLSYFYVMSDTHHFYKIQLLLLRVKFYKWSHRFHEYTNTQRRNNYMCFLSSPQIPYMADVLPLTANLLICKEKRARQMKENSSISERRRKEEIVEWWHHSSRVEVWSFYSHVLSVWHIPQPQKPPPPPPVLVSSIFIEHQTKWCDANRGQRGGDGDMEEGEVGERFATSEGKGRKFPELPPPTLRDHITFPFTALFLCLILLLSLVGFGMGRRLPGVLYFRFTGTLF